MPSRTGRAFHKYLQSLRIFFNLDTMDIPKIPPQETKALAQTKKNAPAAAKKPRIVVLPEKKTFLVQPNRVTYTIFSGFTLNQLKAFAVIMLNLQEAIKLDMNDGDFTQLSLFDKFEQSIKFELSLKDIAKSPSAYRDVKEAINGISETNVKIPVQDASGRKFHVSTSLITALIPDVADYNSTISIKIEKSIAEYLVEVPKGKNGAEQYTRYMLEVALAATCIYTIRIYQLISSWKKSGGFKMSYLEFRKLMAIDEAKYSKYSDFKRKVLKPAQEDLYEKADCWFNCDLKDFKTMERNSSGNKELYLNFKVITPQYKETMLKQRSNVVNLLSNHFNFKDADLKLIAHILDNDNIASDVIVMKIVKISEAIESSYKTSKPVKDKKAYGLQSLLSNDWQK